MQLLTNPIYGLNVFELRKDLHYSCFSIYFLRLELTVGSLTVHFEVLITDLATLV